MNIQNDKGMAKPYQVRQVARPFRDYKKVIASHYTYRVTWSAEDEEYVGLCAEFPSLSWLASTQEEAFSGIRQLVEERYAGQR